ncbi:MAG: AAA family ATPase [Patescibacteria group bacterium]
MFLKSLELNGFKSFASKAVLEFPKGITAIVGPNGSGKSNIIDAIRWLLGEREAKNLRGDKIENLIFAGTSKKSRAGMAQVSLNFDNNSKFGGDEFEEISIVRRVARDGISQYFLNKSEVRLKDIVDFFAKARLGTKGLTIINQGSSDLFVRVSPEERRIIIEEVLGLREFQIKKSDAERKLNNTNINLEKVKAMVGEVLPRLRMLKRQTSKWEKRAQLEAELKNLEDGYFSFKFGEIEKDRRELEPELKKIAEVIVEKNSELKVLENEVKKLEEKSESGDFDLIKISKRELSDKHLKIQKELSRLEAKAEILSQIEEKKEERVFSDGELVGLIKETKNSLEKLVFERPEEIIAAIKKIIEKIDASLALSTSDVNSKDLLKNKELEDFNKIKNDLLKEVALIENDLKQVEKTETEIAAGLQDFNKQFQKAFEVMDAKRDEIRLLENKKQQMIFEREKLDMKSRDLKNQLEQIGRFIGEFADARINVDLTRISADIFETERKMLRLRGELASIGEIDQLLIKEAEETEKYYNFLSFQISDLEKASEDLKILIKSLKEKIHDEFLGAFKSINEKFDYFFRLMFKGGHAKMKIKKYELRIKNNGENEENNEKLEEGQEEKIGVEIDLNLPGKKNTGVEMLSGGEKSLVSIAALFALISVSPPPFLVLDEIDAPLDEKNSQMFANLVKDFSGDTQFIIVTHNRAVMEAADVLYGITMNDDGTSKLLSLKLDTKI